MIVPVAAVAEMVSTSTIFGVLNADRDEEPAVCNSEVGEVVPIPTFWLVSIVIAVVPLFVCNTNAPVLSAVQINAVVDVVPAEMLDAMIYPYMITQR